MRHFALAFAATLSVSAPAFAQDAVVPEWTMEPRDWGETLRADATAVHAAVIDSHPGVHDTHNPEFRARVDAGLALALQRAETTTDAGGWWWAMRAFVGGFDDGHVQIGLKNGGGFPTRWPGFLTAYRDGAHVVASVDDADPSLPPMGARLIECDGIPADDLAASRIGAFRGRWFLEAQRSQLGDWLFMNASNPWVSEMRTCRFESLGETRTWSLSWRAIGQEEIGSRRTALAQTFRPPFGLRTLVDQGVWLSMPSFNGTPGSDAHTAMTALLADASARVTQIRTAPYVVLDLRGNGGGSSHWSRELALVLWGGRWLETHQLAPVEAIEWRASDANLAMVRSYLDDWTAAGESAERIGWAREIVDGMTEARARGEPFWRDAAVRTPRPDYPADYAPLRVAGPVYVLTDPACASACLDAVDLWKAMGAIQIGRETSADTVYMDVRDQALPSDLATLVIPMKVWRGRARGNNEPQRPAHLYGGALSDQAGLEAWVAALSR